MSVCRLNMANIIYNMPIFSEAHIDIMCRFYLIMNTSDKVYPFYSLGGCYISLIIIFCILSVDVPSDKVHLSY